MFRAPLYSHIFARVKEHVICFLAESWLPNSRPTNERRMLAVYLHHDSSVLTNVFCTQVKVVDIGSGWRLLTGLLRGGCLGSTLPKLCHLGLGPHLQQQQAALARHDLEAFWERCISHDPKLQYWETTLGHLGGQTQGKYGDHSGYILWRSFRLHLSCGCTFLEPSKILSQMTVAQFSNFRSSMEMLSWMSSCQPSSLQVSFIASPSSPISLVCWLINALQEKLIRASCLLRRPRSRRELREIGWKMSRRKLSR